MPSPASLPRFFRRRHEQTLQLDRCREKAAPARATGLCRRSVACLFRLLFSTVFRGHVSIPGRLSRACQHSHYLTVQSMRLVCSCSAVSIRDFEKQWCCRVWLMPWRTCLFCWMAQEVQAAEGLLAHQPASVQDPIRACTFGGSRSVCYPSAPKWVGRAKTKSPSTAMLQAMHLYAHQIYLNLHAHAITHSMCWLHLAVYEALDSPLTWFGVQGMQHQHHAWNFPSVAPGFWVCQNSGWGRCFLSRNVGRTYNTLTIVIAFFAVTVRRQLCNRICIFDEVAHLHAY